MAQIPYLLDRRPHQFDMRKEGRKEGLWAGNEIIGSWEYCRLSVLRKHCPLDHSSSVMSYIHLNVEDIMGLSKVLIIGATGGMGKYLTNASIKLGHPTFALVRSTTPSDPAKAELLKSFHDNGVTVLVGEVGNYASLLTALKQVEVVIAAVSEDQLGNQHDILEAAKEAGTIKRFYPSEFGNEVDTFPVDNPISGPIFGTKQTFRRVVEKSGIPYTFVASNSFNSYFVAPLGQDPRLTAPPRDGKLTILGDGNAKAVFNDDADIATYTIRSVEDPRAENKVLVISPKDNVASLNEVIATWEKKIGHTFEKEFLDEEEILKTIEELPFPLKIDRAVKYAILVQGVQTGFDLDPSRQVEATALYPDVNYTRIDQYFDRFV
ncbi:unnamed protein product [Calypogeia fissa]